LGLNLGKTEMHFLVLHQNFLGDAIQQEDVLCYFYDLGQVT